MSKFVYFGVYGRGEKVRILLSYKGVAHTDERIGFEEFGPRKAAGEFPNGQLPVWIHNGKYYNESSAILRYLGKLHGAYPEDAELAYITDNAVDFANDFVGKFYPDQMG
jgi:glutathione S-transferase